MRKGSPLSSDEFALARRYALYFPTLITLDVTTGSSDGQIPAIPQAQEFQPVGQASPPGLQQGVALPFSTMSNPGDMAFPGLSPFGMDMFPVEWEKFRETWVTELS